MRKEGRRTETAWNALKSSESIAPHLDQGYGRKTVQKRLFLTKLSRFFDFCPSMGGGRGDNMVVQQVWLFIATLLHHHVSPPSEAPTIYLHQTLV